MEKVLFERVAIVGVGLLGASLGLALKRRGLCREVVGLGRAGSGSLKVALDRGAIDRGETEAGAAVAGADLVVLCTPVRQFSEMLNKLSPFLMAGAIVTDVGSTKAEVVGWMADLVPATCHFVGSHPMAGSEKSGPEAARENLYERAVCLVCPGKSAEANERVKGLWKAVGMRVMELGPAEHDRWVATISHLPHAAAFALVNAVAKEPAMLEAVAGGFLDTTRVASSDPAMWTDIFMTNKGAVVEAIDLFVEELEGLKAAVVRGDEGAIREAVVRARGTRDALVEKRRGAGLSVKSSQGEC